MSRTRPVRSRGRIAAVLALVGALAVAGDVIAGGSNRTVVRDPVSNIEEGRDISSAARRAAEVEHGSRTRPGAPSRRAGFLVSQR